VLGFAERGSCQDVMEKSREANAGKNSVELQYYSVA
jgi:hypothetical protein